MPQTRPMKITLGLSLELLRKNPPSLVDTKPKECEPQDWRACLKMEPVEGGGQSEKRDFPTKS